jgi:hypothetical protein
MKTEQKLCECVVGTHEECAEQYKKWEEYLEFGGYDADSAARSIEREVKKDCPHKMGAMCSKDDLPKLSQGGNYIDFGGYESFD